MQYSVWCALQIQYGLDFIEYLPRTSESWSLEPDSLEYHGERPWKLVIVSNLLK